MNIMSFSVAGLRLQIRTILTYQQGPTIDIQIKTFLMSSLKNRKKTYINQAITIKLQQQSGILNFDLLKYDFNNLSDDFLSIMYSNFFQHCILEPTRITSNNRPSLLDNIFINTHDKEVYSGNIIGKISAHLYNLVIIKNIFHKKRNQKVKVRDISHFNEIIYKTPRGTKKAGHLEA